MAAAPTEINTKLNYEEQENKILEATKHHPINLVVEESGWLEELEAILYSNRDDFDILHISGQINFQNDQACLLTEDEFGNCCYSNAEKIAHALRDAFPKIIFLCGQTEYSWEEKALSSLAIELIEKGVEVILTVGDEQAEIIISVLYKELARGETILTAMQQIHQEIRNQAKPPQSFLGIYLADTKLLSQALVTKDQKPKTNFGGEVIFRDGRDGAGRMKVANRNNFVGRRRQLQNCLKALKVDTDKVGVLLHGMGGLGKSTIASRIICDRLPDQAYREELTQLKDELSPDHLFDNLAISLEREDWKEADLETAFIFYQLMVRSDYDDFYDLFGEVPLEILEEIDRLWMEYSQGKFGIKGQARIYREKGGTEEYDEDIWRSLAQLGGLSESGWMGMDEQAGLKYKYERDYGFDFRASPGTFLLLYYEFFGFERGAITGIFLLSSLASRLEQL